MGAVPILMYHAIGPAEPGPFQRFAVSERTFIEQLDLISALGMTTVTAAEIGEAATGKRKLPSQAVALTFDDAFTDFTSIALPALRRRGMTATIFVPTAFIGGQAGWFPDHDGRRQILDADELVRLRAAGIEVGAHSRTHPEMDRLRSNRQLESEAAGARKDLERLLSAPVKTFAYPFGYHSTRARQAIAAAGYLAAFATSERIALPARDDRFALPRLAVKGGLSAADFERLLSRPRRWNTDLLAESKRGIWRWMRRASQPRNALARVSAEPEQAS